MERHEAFVVLYVVAILVTEFSAAKGKTSWFSLVGVIIMPVYCMWVLVDAFSSTKEKESQEEQPQSKLVE